MDPKIAVWLLDPDNAPVTFSDTVNMIGHHQPDLKVNIVSVYPVFYR